MEKILNDTFKQIEDITDVHEMTNVQLKRLIKKIEVDKDGNVDIYLRLLGDLGLNESILVEDECENKTALNINDQTQGRNRTSPPDQSVTGLGGP